MSNCLQPQGPQHTRLLCPLPPSRVCSNSCPLSWWCYLPISSSVAPFSFCLPSFLASGSFPVSWLFTSGSQSIGDSVLASALPMNIQGWFPLGLTGLISWRRERQTTPVFLPQKLHEQYKKAALNMPSNLENSVVATGKGQFSFQSQRKAMPKNAQTTTQFHSSHTLAK